MPALVPFDTLTELFQRTARHYDGQQRAALSYKDKATKEWMDISWEKLAERVRSVAGFLHGRGVRPGDRVAILSENRPEWAIMDLAALHLGAVGVALYPTLPADQVLYILQNSEAKWMLASTGLQVKKVEAIFDECPSLEGAVTLAPTREPRSWAVGWDEMLTEGAAYAEQHAAELDRLWQAVQPDDLAALIYTSGTTGLPKMRVSRSCTVSWSAWPMWRRPVTLGGGMAITNGSFSPLLTFCSSAWKKPLCSQKAYHFSSTCAGS